jgi:transcriptional regulator with XRE-family HTH domain
MADMDEEQFPELSIGDRLRQAREAKGLSLDDVASQTRVPVRHLQHIETGDWDALPAVTYSVGFVRAYGNAVGVDGAALGAELREQIGGRRITPTIAEYYEPADPARVPPKALAIVAAVIALLLIAGYLVFRSGVDDGEQMAEQSSEAPAPQPKQAPQPQAATPQSAVGQPVTLTAIGPVWLRVSERGGGTIVERTLAAGETYQVPPTARQPVLRVGAPEALRVTVGQTVIPQLGPSGQPIGNIGLKPEELVARGQGQPQAPQPTR